MKRTTLSIIFAASMGLGLSACTSTPTADTTSGSSNMGTSMSGPAMKERGSVNMGNPANPAATGPAGTAGSTDSTGTGSMTGTTGTNGTTMPPPATTGTGR